MQAVLGQSSGAVGGVLVWMGLLVGLTIAGGVVMIAVRKRALSRDQQSIDTGGLMDSLKAARDAGDLSEEDFRAARLRLLGLDQADATGTSRPLPPAAAARAPSTADFRSDRQAKPGYDLTGDPLPPNASDDEPPA